MAWVGRGSVGLAGGGIRLAGSPGVDLLLRDAEPFHHVLVVDFLVAVVGEVQPQFVDDLGALGDPLAPGFLAEMLVDALPKRSAHRRIGQAVAGLAGATVHDLVAGDLDFLRATLDLRHGLADLLQQRAHGFLRHDVALFRRDGEALRQHEAGIVLAVELDQQLPKHLIRPAVGGIELDGLFIGLHRVVGLVGVLVGVAQTEPAHGVFRVRLGHVFPLCDTFFQVHGGSIADTANASRYAEPIRHRIAMTEPGLHQHWLDWQRPALHSAVDWLRLAAPPVGRSWDLAGWTLALPGSRAVRRLRELLAEAAEAGRLVLSPPRIVTVGFLPELLYTPPLPIADDLVARLAWVHAIRQQNPAQLAAISPEPPTGFQGFWQLAGELQTVYRTLAGEGLGMADVADRGDSVEGFSEREAARWQALAMLQEAMQAHLADRGCVDRDAARLAALQALTECPFAGNLAMIAVADMPGVVQRVIRAAAAHIPVHALIFAPASLAEAFNDVGCFVPGMWTDRPIAIADDRIRVVDQPDDQAEAVLRELAHLPPEQFGPDDITVGLGDDKLGPAVEHTLSLADLPVRGSVGKTLASSRPVLLLEAFGRFLLERRFSDFTGLLRHPDLETYLARMLSDSQAVRDWLTLFDTFATETLAMQADTTALGPGSPWRERLAGVYEAVYDLLRDAEGRPIPLSRKLNLTDAADAVQRLLSCVYGPVDLSRMRESDALQIAALESAREAIIALRSAEVPDAPDATTLNLSEAMQLIASLAGEATAPATGGTAAIELLGLLELPLDDAPVLVLVGVNEGAMPSSRPFDALLPDSLKGAIGLPTDVTRYARDAMLLTAIQSSRPHVTLVTGRRSSDGTPLTPSRLLLACDRPTMVGRIARFYDDDAAPQPRLSLLTPGTDRFLLPYPQPLLEPITELNVTGFRSYLACPYRFYLRHVLRLSGIDDKSIEFDAAAFGSLAHDVLAAFGRSELIDATDADAISGFLAAEVDRQLEAKCGSHLRQTLRIQAEQLKGRLRAFSQLQASWRDAGWRIEPSLIEKRYTATVTVDGQPFSIVGRIDRVDVHPQLGYRLLDYKTSSVGKDPIKSHVVVRDGCEAWVDLQLPLYQMLGVSEGVLASGRPVSLGYVSLPKKLADASLVAVEWPQTLLEQAYSQRDEVIRKLRDQVFWPPAEPARYSDDYSLLCGDEVIAWESLIDASGRGGRPEVSQ